MTGTYTNIVNIIAPSVAAPGVPVTVEVQIKSIYLGGTIVVTATGKINNVPIYFGGVGYYVAYGVTKSYYETFIMPDHGVNIQVWSWVQATDGSWIVDDYGSVGITASIDYPASDIANFDIQLPTGSYVVGDYVSYNASFSYKGKPQNGTLVIELGTGFYPLFSSKYTYPAVTVSFNGSVVWQESSKTGAILLPSSLVVGQTYSVRATLKTADGAQEVDTDWGVLTVVGEEPPNGYPASDIADLNFIVPSGEYAPGDMVDYTVSYKHKGPTEAGTLIVELGTGLIGTFFTAYTYAVIPVAFPASYEWLPGVLSGSLELPLTLKYGQTYNTRATLRANSGQQEIDTDWGVIGIISSPSKTPFRVSEINVTNYYNKTTGSGTTLGPGELLNIDLNFKYKSGYDTTESLWASLGIGIGRDIESFKNIQLSASLVGAEWSGSTEIQIPASGKSDGVYWMKVEIGGKEVTIQQAATLTGMPETGMADLGNLLLMMVMVMMMSMVMNIIQEPREFVATAKEVVAPVVKIFAGKEK